MLLSSMSLAIEPPWVDAHVGVLGETPSQGVGANAGAGISVGEGPFYLEARIDGALISSKSRLAMWPSFRTYLRDVDKDRGLRPSLVAGLGAQFGHGTDDRALIMGGVDFDLPGGDGWTRPRFGVWAEGTLQGTVRAGLKFGVVHRSGRVRVMRSNPTPFVVDKDEALADLRAKDPVETSTDPGEGPWWDPKVCEWVDEDPGYGWRPEDGVGVLGTSEAGDAGVSGGDSGSGTSVAAGQVRQGWLVVVAQPGAVVRLPGDMEQVVTEEGVAKLRAAEGVVDVEVVGGGRTQTFEAAIADGYVLWLRADPPDEVAVMFASGSSEVDDADRVAAQALARNRGQFRLQLSGSFSPEGNRAYNLRLARSRAEAIAALLTEVGVPADDIEILEPTPPRAGLTAAQQRAVYIQPVAQGVNR